jgi:hypothetical protein
MEYNGYGYMRVKDPRHFKPDKECATPEELARHTAAVDAFNEAEKNGVATHYLNGGWEIYGVFYPGDFGIGLYWIEDE